MDPLGVGLENFDAIGRYRTEDDEGFAVDARGELPSGLTFSGAVEIADVIERSGEFERCLARNFLEYAIGRRVDTRDQCTLNQMTAELTPDSTFSDLIFAIVTSAPFSTQKLPETSP